MGRKAAAHMVLAEYGLRIVLSFTIFFVQAKAAVLRDQFGLGKSALKLEDACCTFFASFAPVQKPHVCCPQPVLAGKW